MLQRRPLKRSQPYWPKAIAGSWKFPGRDTVLGHHSFCDRHWGVRSYGTGETTAGRPRRESLLFAKICHIGTARFRFSQAPQPATDRVDEGDSVPLEATFI